MAIYNAALCYEKAGDVDMAVAVTGLVQTLSYQGIPMSFCSSATLLRDNGREEEASMNTLAEARGLYPREQSLIIEELNIYLTNMRNSTKPRKT